MIPQNVPITDLTWQATCRVLQPWLPFPPIKWHKLSKTPPMTRGFGLKLRVEENPDLTSWLMVYWKSIAHIHSISGLRFESRHHSWTATAKTLRTCGRQVFRSNTGESFWKSLELRSRRFQYSKFSGMVLVVFEDIQDRDLHFLIANRGRFFHVFAVWSDTLLRRWFPSVQGWKIFFRLFLSLLFWCSSSNLTYNSWCTTPLRSWCCCFPSSGRVFFPFKEPGETLCLLQRAHGWSWLPSVSTPANGAGRGSHDTRKKCCWLSETNYQSHPNSF